MRDVSVLHCSFTSVLLTRRSRYRRDLPYLREHEYKITNKVQGDVSMQDDAPRFLRAALESQAVKPHRRVTVSHFAYTTGCTEKLMLL
jgi:hypothetical protein